MARVRRFRNPFRFTPGPVALFTSLTYILLAAALLYVHHVPPKAPRHDSPVKGTSLSEAWADLQALSSAYRPYASRRNDDVRTWLLGRIEDILKTNDADYDIENGPVPGETRAGKHHSVVIYNDLYSNTTFSSSFAPSIGVYFEGTNIIVYIAGSQELSRDSDERNRGVLVNAHYDSVPTGFGATDDGVGVVTILQLIKHYTTSGNRPKRGIVALLNNGEENYLNGAWAFLQHSISSFPDTFLNLEGAGAGGRAALFRSTDAEVTEYYRSSPYPFGSIISADGFNRGLIRSQTDYVVFNGELGLRGLDVAFMEPRSRYHTTQDSTRWTSKDSLWHMLSAALATMDGLTSDTTTNFSAHSGSPGVWWDMFGRGFGLLNMDALFALSVTLLVIGPVAVVGILVALKRVDREYLFSRKKKTDLLDPHAPDEQLVVHFSGWRGLSRLPVAFVLASAAAVAVAFLIAKVNPFIVYSSQYAVMSAVLSAWVVVAWFWLRGADFMRPTALHRAHAYGWLFFLFWILLLVVTVSEKQLKIGGGYFMVIYYAGIFVALAISYLEFFSLPTVNEFVQIAGQRRESEQRGTDAPGSSDPQPTGEESEATERTSLLGRSNKPGQSFARYRQNRPAEWEEDGETPRPRLQRPFGDEQDWSGGLPSWLWIIQFLVTAPIVIILVGQIALLMISGIHQTPADGNPVRFIYGSIAVLSILLLLPTAPFLHRFSSKIPLFLLLVFFGTLIYNCLAFPFSPANRLKVFFVQQVDLDTGLNKASLTGLDGYVQKIVRTLPSASEHAPECSASSSRRLGLTTCTWPGLAPRVVPDSHDEIKPPKTPSPPEKRYETWLALNVTRSKDADNEAVIDIAGRNSRGCRLVFETPISEYKVRGSDGKAWNAEKKKKQRAKPDGVSEIRLWSREWERGWSVHVKWNQSDSASVRGEVDGAKKKKGLDGKAVCEWSDINEPGVIPAFDEVKRFMPAWSVAVNYGDGLVEGSKRFLV